MRGHVDAVEPPPNAARFVIRCARTRRAVGRGVYAVPVTRPLSLLAARRVGVAIRGSRFVAVTVVIAVLSARVPLLLLTGLAMRVCLTVRFPHSIGIPQPAPCCGAREHLPHASGVRTRNSPAP